MGVASRKFLSRPPFVLTAKLPETTKGERRKREEGWGGGGGCERKREGGGRKWEN